jgi:dihydrofolate reductase
MARNNVIGKGGTMPWHMPADLKHFKKVTMNKPVVMGRKTFESIGKPLPGRRNIIISRQENLKLEGCEVYNNIQNVFEILKNESEVMIIGGGQLYAKTLPFADRLYITHLDADIDGDTQFPDWNENEWEEVFRESHQPDEKNPYPYAFVNYQRLAR